MREKPKDRHAKINFENPASPPTEPPGYVGVTFVRDALGNIRAMVPESSTGIHASNHYEGGGDEVDITQLGGFPGGTSAFLRADGSFATPSGTSGTTSELWSPPDSADSFDDEFTTTSLGAGWTVYDSDGSTVITPSGTIDPYASFSGVAVKVQTHNYRRSWLTTQVSNDNAPHYFMKAWTPNTNDVMWARVGHTQRPATAASDGTVVLMLMAATAGHPDPDNRIGIWWVPNTGVGQFARRMFFHKTTGGVGSDVFVTSSYVAENAVAVGMYFVIQKRSTTYDAWIFDGLGSAWWLGSTTFAPTLAYAGFMFNDNSSGGTKPGNTIFYADFIRLVQNTSTYLPGT